MSQKYIQKSIQKSIQRNIHRNAVRKFLYNNRLFCNDFKPIQLHLLIIKKKLHNLYNTNHGEIIFKLVKSYIVFDEKYLEKLKWATRKEYKKYSEMLYLYF